MLVLCAGKLESLLQSDDCVTFGFHLPNQFHRFGKSRHGSLVFALKAVQMGELAQSQSDSVFPARFAKDVEAFSEKSSRGSKPALVNCGGPKVQRNPGIGPS